MEWREEATRLRLAGYTYREIAEKIGISQQRIQQVLSPPAAIREYIVARDQGECQACGIRVGISGHVHHQGNALEIEEYNDINNLQLLCPGCHRRAHPPTSRTLDGIAEQAGFGLYDGLVRLAQLTGESVNHIYRVLGRTQTPSPRLARELAEILGVPLGELFPGQRSGDGGPA